MPRTVLLIDKEEDYYGGTIISEANRCRLEPKMADARSVQDNIASTPTNEVPSGSPIASAGEAVPISTYEGQPNLAR